MLRYAARQMETSPLILFLGPKEDTKELVCFVYCLTFGEMNSLLSSFDMEQTFL
jgi:hypothetical protein